MTAPIACRRAVASLLRLAQRALRDARVLVESGSPAGAGALQDVAAARLMAAVAASEFGWPDSAADRGAGSLDDANPVKERLVSLTGRDSGPDLLPDGRLPPSLEDAAARDGINRLGDLLTEIAGHFGVDFNRDEPARSADPIRDAPDPVTEPEPDPDPDPVRLAKPVRSPNAPIVFVPKPRPATPAAPKPSEPSPMIQPSQTAPGGSSVSFWALMDRWNLPDLDALALIGHKTGLTKKGTRPRFKLSPSEADLLKLLRDIDGALTSLDLQPEKWLRQPIGAAPFDGAKPIAYALDHGTQGVRDLSRYAFQEGLRRSLGRGP